MERLDSFDFSKRPSRSRYAAVVKALVDEGVHAVRITRGVDFPDELQMDTVQGSISQQIRKAGKRARTYRESEDVLIVGLNEEAAPRRRGGRARELAAA